MKKRILLSLCATCLLMTGCREKKEPQPAASTSTPLESSTEAPKKTSTDQEIPKENPPAEVSTDGWVRDADFSTDKTYHFPWLNEELFGNLATEFNADIKEIYEEIGYSLEEGAYAEEYAESTNYEIFKDSKTETFSIVFQFPYQRKFIGYRTMVLDVASKKKLSFSDFLSRYHFTEEDVKDAVIRYHESMYKAAAEDFGYEELQDFETYIQERLNDFTAQIEGRPDPTVGEHYDVGYGLLEGKPVVHVSSLDPINAEPFASTKYDVPIRLRKNLAEFAVENATMNTTGILIRYPSIQDIKYANPLKTIETENASPEDQFLLIVMRDDVQVDINALTFDEKEADTKIGDSYYSGTLQKGQSLLIRALLPEGIPSVMMTLSYKENYEGTEYTFRAKKIFYENGAFKDPSIEYLEGRTESQ